MGRRKRFGPPRRCAFCGSTRNLQPHHVGTRGKVIWVCEKCHRAEHKRFKVVSPNRKAFRRMCLSEALDIEKLRKELSIYG